MGFKENKIIYGMIKNKMVFPDETLLNNLILIGKKLNLSNSSVKTRSSSGSMIDLPLTQGIHIYKTMKLTLENLLAKTDKEIIQQIEKLNVTQEENQLELNESVDIYYITKPLNIFPQDVKLSDQTYDLSLNKRLRPEFIKSYTKSLSTDPLEI